MGSVTMLPSAMVDTGRYDLADRELAASCSRGLRDEGVSVLPGFVSPSALRSMVDESDRLAPTAFRSVSSTTCYLGEPDPSLPDTHPGNRLVHGSVEVVAYDRFPAESPLRALYEWDPLLDFVRRCLGLEQLHRYADPLGALNLAVMRDGDRLGWHFDMSDFVVSIALQASESGGEFENAPHIRGVAGEGDENVEEVRAVLDGDRSRVRVEPMTPGTLMLFAGRRSLHRVSPVVGDRPRYVALLAYAERPDVDSTDTLKLSRYGRLP